MTNHAPTLIEELVRISSPSLHEEPAVQHLVNWMQAHGFTAHRDEIGNAVGRRGREDAPHTLILLGHIDTVEGNIPVHIEDGCLFGRGSVDAKGSLCTFAEAVARATIPADWQVIVIGAVEEEIATSKGAYHIRSQFLPDLCIIGEPSGVDRITLGYKGRLLVDYVLSRPIAHSARVEPSVGAIGVQFWNEVAAWAESINDGRERYFDQILARLRSINTASDGFEETVSMTLGFRLPSDYDPDTVFEAVRAFAPDDAQLKTYSAEKAYEGDKNNALVRGMLTAIRRHAMRPNFVVKTGTSDMNVVGARWSCPIVAYGPGDSNLDHTPHEHLRLADYETAIQVLTFFIENLV